MTIPAARPASTVVLVRPSRRRFDVFLVRRHDRTAFGGAHVFPGGRVDDADALDSPDSLCDGVVGAQARMSDLSARDAIAYQIAAVRELFEEAGVLLARRRNGRIIDFGDPAEADRFLAYRGALERGTVTMREVAESEALRIALDELAPFAHWITPAMETKRYDTRFFVAAVPEGQEPVHVEGETTHSEWMDPADALDASRRNAIQLPAPTWTTMRALEKLADVGEVMAWARRQVIVPVQPGFIQRDGVSLLTLPGDPEHPPLEGFETPEETRFILDGATWRAQRPPSSR